MLIWFCNKDELGERRGSRLDTLFQTPLPSPVSVWVESESASATDSTLCLGLVSTLGLKTHTFEKKTSSRVETFESATPQEISVCSNQNDFIGFIYSHSTIALIII